MSNIQTIRNTVGFTRMDNSLMEAVAAVDLPGRELRILMAIARNTIGYQQESRRITADELAKLTNIRRDVASKAISHLLARRVIFRVGGSRGEIGISPVGEWQFFEPANDRLSETKTSHSDNVVTLVSNASETKNAHSLLYTKKEPLVTVPSEQITAPQGAEHASDEEPAKQLVTFDGEDFQVDHSLITKWAKTYAPIDVEAEIARAAAWASANRPKKDYRRFLVNWIARKFKECRGVDESNIPVDKIIALYHQTCPNLAPVSVTGDKVLRGLICERWNEAEAHKNSGFWRSMFDKANRLNQVWYRGANVNPHLEVICSRAVFRQLEAQQ